MSLIGFTTLNGEEFTPDKTLSRTVTPKMHMAKFGDGYEQRARKGLNSLDESFDVTFSNRTLTESQQLVEFFAAVLGVTSFTFTIPGKELTDYVSCRVVCETFNRTYDFNNYNTITATFRKVYEAQVGGVVPGDSSINVLTGAVAPSPSAGGGSY